MTWMGYEECRDRALHMRTFGGLTPEETALGCTISEVLPRNVLQYYTEENDDNESVDSRYKHQI